MDMAADDLLEKIAFEKDLMIQYMDFLYSGIIEITF